jgi:carboxylesterase
MTDLSGDERVRAFAVDGGTVGCLLLHGFTGTPAEMRPLAERLAERGYSVRAPLLPGHGTRPEDLAPTRWPDWFGAAEESWDELGRVAPVRSVAGLSMGALLALHLAHERPREVRAVAALAPALELANQRGAGLALWLRRLPRLPRRFEIVPKRNSGGAGKARLTPAYDEIPLRALASMIDLQRVVAGELAGISAPVLLVEGGRDETVSLRSAAVIESRLGSPVKTRLRFANSGHILTEDVEVRAILDAVERFFARHTSAGTA